MYPGCADVKPPSALSAQTKHTRLSRNKTETLLTRSRCLRPPSTVCLCTAVAAAAIMCLETLHSLNLSDSIMHSAARPPSLLSVCLNTPLYPKHTACLKNSRLSSSITGNMCERAPAASRLCVICLTMPASPTPLTPNVFERRWDRVHPSPSHLPNHLQTHTGMAFTFCMLLMKQRK